MKTKPASAGPGRMSGAEVQHEVRRVLWIVLALNLAVAVAKLVVGLVAGSLAVQSDAVHSTIDAINNVVGLVALAYAAAPPDREHPYGHGKIETLAAFGVASFIALTGFELARMSLRRLFLSTAPQLPPQDAAIPAVMLITLAINVFVSWYEHRRGKALGSSFLLADAAHTRSDVLVTAAVLASWVFVRGGFSRADPIVSLLVVCIIGRIGYRVFARTVPILIDAARIPLEQIRATVVSVPGVVACDRLRHRGEGRLAFVECRIAVQQPQDGIHAHEITEEIERRLYARFGIPRDNVTIHVEVSGE